MKFRTKYDRRKVFSPSGVKSMTDQQYKDDCSIDGIIKRYGVLGQPVPQSFGSSVDCTKFSDFSSIMNRVVDANSKFMALPSELRQRFGHSPEAFYNWLSDPSHHEEAISLGLMVKKEEVKDGIALLERIAANTTPKEVASEV